MYTHIYAIMIATIKIVMMITIITSEEVQNTQLVFFSLGLILSIEGLK